MLILFLQTIQTVGNYYLKRILICLFDELKINQVTNVTVIFKRKIN